MLQTYAFFISSFCYTMEDIRVIRSSIPSPSRRHEDEYNPDELNAKGAFNNSSMYAVATSELVEPAGWHLEREYHVVTRGSVVGIFHNL